MNIIFLGTPEFAVASLDAIHKSKHNVLAVVTTPDKPAGRGQKLSQSAVKKYAVSENIPVLQPKKLKSKEFIQQLNNYNPDIMVVVAFRILPETIFTLPKLGTFNLHASLLPNLRGAAPINYAIINGLEETGVTTFFLDKNVDTGNILLQEKVTILPTETAGSLYSTLMHTGKHLVVKTLDLLEDGKLKSKPQPKSVQSYAPKIHKEFCQIDWSDSLENIDRKIRGLSPYPCSFTFLKDNNSHKIFKIYNGKYIIKSHLFQPKNIIFENQTLKIVHKEGFYIPTEVQIEGKRKMNISDFINGLQNKENLTVV